MNGSRKVSRPARGWDFLWSAIQPIRNVLDTIAILTPPLARQGLGTYLHAQHLHHIDHLRLQMGTQRKEVVVCGSAAGGSPVHALVLAA